MMSDVFIIGAGCSVPYGFPTGTMLMQKLKNFNYGRKFPRDGDSTSDIFLVDLYQEHFGYSSADNRRQYGKDYTWVLPYSKHEDLYNRLMDEIVLPFSQSIRHSMMVSTDEFLKNRLGQKQNEQADFGKRLIAYEILKAEQASRLGNIDWIQHLLSRIDQQSNWEEILKQTVFLTFNYDRVLEYCIFLYLTSDKQYADADAHSFIKEMQIFHVNGFIGSLEEIPFGAVENGKYQEIAKRMETVWEKRPLEEIPFGAVENGKYQEIAKRMETVWEKRRNRDESEKEKYQGFLKNAERVYFMGFSYIPDNLESIGIPRSAEIIRNAKVYATAMGLSSQNRLRISTYLDLKDFEKRNEPELTPEMTLCFTRNENRILKDASAVDLILDYYTLA